MALKAKWPLFCVILPNLVFSWFTLRKSGWQSHNYGQFTITTSSSKRLQRAGRDAHGINILLLSYTVSRYYHIYTVTRYVTALIVTLGSHIDRQGRDNCRSRYDRWRRGSWPAAGVAGIFQPVPRGDPVGRGNNIKLAVNVIWHLKITKNGRFPNHV